MRCPPGSRAFLAYSVHAVNHRRFFRAQPQLNRKRFAYRAQFLPAIPEFRAPVSIPDFRLFLARPRNSRPRSVCPLRVIELPAVQVAQRQMRQVQVAHVPRAVLLGIAAHTLAEKRQLKSEPPPIFRSHISGVIPPLRLILRMVEVIPRKLVLVSGQRRLKISIALPREEQHERENSRPTPHARPQADPASPPRAPDKTPPAPSPRTPPSTLPAAPPPANGNESSIRMTAC